jgi:dienelactone hydrolase
MTRRPTMVAGILLLTSSVLVACGSGSTPKTTGPGPCRTAPPVRTGRSERGIAEVTATFVDRSRPTPATDEAPARPCRVLPTIVRLPQGQGPAPAVVAAHGLDGDPSALRDLLDVWANAGYVVVAPTFPITEKDEAGNSLASESVAQAKDLRFVLDQVLAANAPGASPWSGRIDPAHIGAAGMSLGGLAVYALTTGSCCTDPRVEAAVLLAAVHRDLPDSRQQENSVPMLLEHGDADVGYHNSLDAYSDLVAPKWFVTLHGARHSGPFEVPRGPEKGIVDATTVDFWDLTLRGDAAGAARLAGAVRDAGDRASLRAAPRLSGRARQPTDVGSTPTPAAALLSYAASAKRRISSASSGDHQRGPSPVRSQRNQCRPESRKLLAQSSSSACHARISPSA